MSREEHVGREWSVSLVAGREKRRVMRWVDKVTGEKKRGSGSFVGRFEGEDTAIVCNWLEDGDIEVIFPAMGEGRYAFAIDFSGNDGRVERFLSGWVGYLAPESVIKGITGEEDPVTIVCMGEHSSEVWTLAGEAIDYSAQEAIKAAERAEEARDSVLEKLSVAQAFMLSFNEALYNSISVVNNELYVGGKSTGHYLKGEDGVTPHIGLDGYWYAGEKKLSDRPAFGKDGITPHITSDGYWAFGDFKTNVKAEGRDGLDGSAVRMILVDSYEDIPQSGDTCNGGYRYLVKKEGWALIGNEYAARDVAWSAWEVPGDELPDYFNTIKVEEALNTNTTPVYLLVRTASGEVLGISRNSKTWTPGDTVVWDFDEDVVIPHGEKIRLILRISNTAITGPIYDDKIKMQSRCGDGGSRWLFDNVWYGGGSPYLFAYGRGSGLNYDVYTWVENKSGTNCWIRVDRTDQIANSRVYGLMKYATDMTVEGGAPVGQNADGQASVPLAGDAVPGVVRASSTEADETSGGQTYMEDGKLFVKKSTPSLPGVGKTSYTQEVENTGTVGMTADGKFAVPKADVRQWGCCRIGTVVRQTNGAPYIIPMGRAADGLTERPNGLGGDISGQLMMNTLNGGALRTTSKETWLNWAPTGIDVSTMPDNSNAVGIMAHNLQFRQTAAFGLELVAATTSTLAGVRLAETLSDNREAAVPTAQVVVNYLSEHYYDKSQVYTKQETASKVEEAMGDYATQSWVQGNYTSKSGMQTALARKMECQPGVCERTVWISASEFAALSEIDPLTEYKIYAG